MSANDMRYSRFNILYINFICVSLAFFLHFHHLTLAQSMPLLDRYNMSLDAIVKNLT